MELYYIIKGPEEIKIYGTYTVLRPVQKTDSSISRLSCLFNVDSISSSQSCRTVKILKRKTDNDTPIPVVSQYLCGNYHLDTNIVTYSYDEDVCFDYYANTGGSYISKLTAFVYSSKASSAKSGRCSGNVIVGLALTHVYIYNTIPVNPMGGNQSTTVEFSSYNKQGIQKSKQTSIISYSNFVVYDFSEPTLFIVSLVSGSMSVLAQ